MKNVSNGTCHRQIEGPGEVAVDADVVDNEGVEIHPGNEEGSGPAAVVGDAAISSLDESPSGRRESGMRMSRHGAETGGAVANEAL